MVDDALTIITIIIFILLLISVYLGIWEILKKLREGKALINEWKNKAQ